MTLPYPSPTGQNLADEFVRISCLISGSHARYGLRIRPFDDRNLPFFSALDAQNQLKTVHCLNEFWKCIEATEAAGDGFDDCHRSLWHAFARLGLVPPHDLFTNMPADAVVEIYDLSGFQIWRSFNFMKFSSYTLEEIYCLEWFRRYHRSKEADAICFAIIKDVMEGKTSPVHFTNMGEHEIEETSSRDRLLCSANHAMIASLRNRAKKIEAWVVVSSVRILGSHASKHNRPEEQLRPNAQGLHLA